MACIIQFTIIFLFICSRPVDIYYKDWTQVCKNFYVYVIYVTFISLKTM